MVAHIIIVSFYYVTIYTMNSLEFIKTSSAVRQVALPHPPSMTPSQRWNVPRRGTVPCAICSLGSRWRPRHRLGRWPRPGALMISSRVCFQLLCAFIVEVALSCTKQSEHTSPEQKGQSMNLVKQGNCSACRPNLKPHRVAATVGAYLTG